MVLCEPSLLRQIYLNREFGNVCHHVSLAAFLKINDPDVVELFDLAGINLFFILVIIFFFLTFLYVFFRQ